MDDETRMTCEPVFDPRMFVSGVVVGDQMDFEIGPITRTILSMKRRGKTEIDVLNW